MKNNIKAFANLLNPIFLKLPIDLVYLFGSQVSGKSDKFSDYDFGVLFSSGLAPNKRFDFRLKLFGLLADKIEVNEDKIDVVDLKEAPTLLQFSVISGKIIYCKNTTKKFLFESYIMSLYNDEHYYLDSYLSDTIHKIKKGVYFGHKLSYS